MHSRNTEQIEKELLALMNRMTEERLKSFIRVLKRLTVHGMTMLLRQRLLREGKIK